MQFGISTASYYGRLEADKAAEVIAALGVDCCEVFMQTYSEYSPAFGEKLRHAIGDFPVTSIHTLPLHFESCLGSAGKKQRQEAWALFEGALGAGQAMGATRYVLHGFANLHGEASRPSVARFTALAREASELCARYGHQLCWENVSWCFFTRFDMVDLLAGADPELGFTLDVKQAMRVGLDPAALALAMGSRLSNVHICDVDENARPRLPGKGVVDFEAFGRALAAIHYAGPVILEMTPDTFSDDEELVCACDYLEKRLRR